MACAVVLDVVSWPAAATINVVAHRLEHAERLAVDLAVRDHARQHRRAGWRALFSVMALK